MKGWRARKQRYGRLACWVGLSRDGRGFPDKTLRYLKTAGALCERQDCGSAQGQQAEARWAEIKKVAADGVTARKEATAEKKRLAEHERTDLQVAFSLCCNGCRCGAEHCPMANKQRCPHCKDIKNGPCRKKVCKDASNPLLLTYQAAPEPPTPME